jgi:hypothetical protein
VNLKAWSLLVPGQEMNEHRFKSNRFLAEICAKGVMPLSSGQTDIKDRGSTISLAFRKGIKRVRSLVDAEISKFPDDISKPRRINQLLDTIMNNFIVLKVVTGSVSESLDIFLTLNNRGVPLGASDLVRGVIMGYLSHGELEKDQPKIHKKIFDDWKTIADQVRDPEAFLRHYLVATGREKVQKKKVFQPVQARLKNDDPQVRRENSESFWLSVCQAAETYSLIINPKMGGDIQLHLEMLEGLIKSHRIILLTAFELVTDQGELSEIARATMVLAYRWVMDGGDAQMLEDFYQDQSAILREGFGATIVVDNLKPKADFKLDASEYLRIEGDFSYVSRALLSAVNKRLAPNANQIKLDSTVHLEHIAPQTETDDWKTALFGGDQSRFDEYEEWISQIKNLTLLDFKINVRLQQKLFGEKKAKYDQSLFIVSRELKHLNEWTIDQIEAGTEWLTECFETIWSVDKGTKAIESFPAWLAAKSA